jgi:CRISPR/Cas system CSM-associated protein Csm3 (group 7 of RAMP superfamily)
MGNQIYLMALQVQFPEGAAPGDGKGGSNRITIAKNGRNKPVLRGSAIAGVLRHAYYTAYKATDDGKKWFGTEQGADDAGPTDSRLKISDIELSIGKSCETIRTHNCINRHTGTVVDGGVFSLEALPPGCDGTLYAELDGKGRSDKECETFLEHLAALTVTGLFFGGNRNRGIGRAVFGDLQYKAFDCSSVEGYAAFLNARYRFRCGVNPEFTETIKGKSAGDRFTISIDLGVPRGEDILVGYGQTMDYMLEPQWVNGTDGKTYWRIPGSSIRGVFKAWMSRLAALDGYAVRDDAAGYSSGKNDITGENLGWGFVIDTETRKEIKTDPSSLKDPVLSLFGSFYSRGRIHFSDALAEMAGLNDKQARMHVAVDRFSGGAIEGSLYENAVIASPAPVFQTTITLDNASEKEIDWLFKSLKALHLGILSIGSSKSSGRLSIKNIRNNDPAVFTIQFSSFKRFLEDNHE